MNAFVKPDQYRFTFISSFGGAHDYGIFLRDGSQSRLRVQSCREERREYSTLSPEEWERDVNGKLGLYSCGEKHLLSLDVTVAFNKQRFAEYSAQVKKIKENPERYGDYTPEPFKVYVAGEFHSATGWTVLHDFETIRELAGIPADECINPRA